jgi:hypothetical protein
MALFSRVVRNVHHNGTGRVVIIEQHQPGLPPYYKHLSVLCNNLGAHPLPMPLAAQFSHFEVSNRGQRVAVYRCTCSHCRCVQGFARHHMTGKPFRLFVRYA